MMATRLPESSRSGGQAAGCRIGPSKLSWPSNWGNFGLANVPTAVTTTLASMVSGPSGVSLSSTQTLRPSSKVARFRSRLNSVWSKTPYLREMCSR